MALNLDRFKKDLQRIVTDLPVSFSYNGTLYQGFAGQKVTQETLEPGGYLDDLDRNLHVPVFKVYASNGSITNTFPGVVPDLGETLVIVSDGTYKVTKLTRAQDGLLLTYGLETTSR